MDEKLFECAVCLETCRECINCMQCNQLLCKGHVKDLDRCPFCRDAPFRYSDNIALQRIIRELKSRMGTTTPPPPRDAGDEFAGALSLATLAAGAASAVSTLIDSISSTTDRVETEDTATYLGLGEHVLANTSVANRSTANTTANIAETEATATETLAVEEDGEEVVEVDPRYGSKVPRMGRHLGEFKKVPNPDHADTMKRHASRCRHAGCRVVWNGPWGNFIGGEQGSSHFDLTDCRAGKRLNKLIGWNYRDPHC